MLKHKMLKEDKKFIHETAMKIPQVLAKGPLKSLVT